jgi:hypothetical protein
LTDHLVLVGANEMPQEPFGGLLVNKRGKASAFWPSPSMQLDYMMAVINAFLKRWRVPHFSNRRTIHPQAINRTSQDPNSWARESRDINFIASRRPNYHGSGQPKDAEKETRKI